MAIPFPGPAEGWGNPNLPIHEIVVNVAPRAKNVLITQVVGDIFTISWDVAASTVHQQFGALNNYVLTGTWEIHYCPASVAGDPGDANFSSRCLSLSTVIASPAHAGSYTIHVPKPGNAYIQVLGISPYGNPGIPSDPVLIDSNGEIVAGPGGAIRNGAIGLARVTGGIKMTYAYDAPGYAEFAGFGGMHFHITGYLGFSDAQEFGSFSPYPYGLRPGGHVRASQIYAEDLNAVTLYFVSVGRDGSRADDITTSPLINIAGGITA